MAKLHEIVSFLDEELQIAKIPDYPGAHNGLQLQNGGEVEKVVSAVDASLPVIRKTIEQGADLLVVHHGMFWQGVKPLTGAFYAKIKEAMDAGLSIYSAHIPLDIHPRLGNSVLLADAIGLKQSGTFMDWKGFDLGVSGEMEISLRELKEKVSQAVNGPVLSCGDEDSAVGKVGIITGGAGSEIERVAKAGINTFITGEGPHWSHPLAEELGLKFIYGGHYGTETFGVRALVELLSVRFQTSASFVHYPTGL